MKNGVWLFNNGVGPGLFLDENKTDKPDVMPQKGAGKVASFLLHKEPFLEGIYDVPPLRAWINMNPPPSGDEEKSIEWFNSVCKILILGGITLMWRGTIYTTLKEHGALAKLLALEAELVDKLKWAPSDSVALHVIAPDEPAEETTVTWGTLLGLPSPNSQEENEVALPGLNTAPAPLPDVGTSLKQLKSLLDEGLISQDEYTTRREAILARL